MLRGVSGFASGHAHAWRPTRPGRRGRSRLRGRRPAGPGHGGPRSPAAPRSARRNPRSRPRAAPADRRRWASKPADTMTSSGAKPSRAGRMRSPQAARNSAPPAPGGSGTLTTLLAMPRSRAEAGAGIERILMRRGVEQIGIGLDDGLRALAVMDVEIDDGHALDAVFRLGMPCPHRDVVEKAEAAGNAGRGMMAGRADRRERRPDLAFHHRLDARHHGAGGAATASALPWLMTVSPSTWTCSPGPGRTPRIAST